METTTTKNINKKKCQNARTHTHAKRIFLFPKSLILIIN